MRPIEINEKDDPVGPCPDGSGRRASLKGFLSVSLARYLELLDWTGRQLHAGKVGAIPEQLAPILSRIGVDATGWCDVVARFGRVFKRAAGTPESLAQEAIRSGQRWMLAHRESADLAKQLIETTIEKQEVEPGKPIQNHEVSS